MASILVVLADECQRLAVERQLRAVEGAEYSRAEGRFASIAEDRVRSVPAVELRATPAGSATTASSTISGARLPK